MRASPLLRVRQELGKHPIVEGRIAGAAGRQMSELPIVRIAEDCGFANQSHLTAGCRAAHTVTPAQFCKKAGRA